MTVQLGNLKSLKLKAVWNHEEHDFTPWLADEDNLSMLSEALGMELQLERIEVPVGPYYADILAKDASGEYVVIENQFGKTNHDHLGKLLTYGATLGASSVVWIAEKFTEEHKKAVDWLNERTIDTLSVYAVQLEVLQINDSLPAIRFNVIGQPNQVIRAVSVVKASGSLTDAQQMQFEFWTEFREILLKKKIVPSAQTPRPQYWFDVPVGKSNVFISNILDTSNERIGVRLYIGNRVVDSILPVLMNSKMEIESEIGQELVWNPTPNKRDKIIGLFRKVDLSNRELWPEYCEWLAENVSKFKKSFSPRVKAIRIGEQVLNHE